MASCAVGERAGVILSGDSKTKVMKWLGYGVRLPDEVPVDAGGWIGEMLRDQKIPNPCIQLDNGDRVYGCECWWGSEAAIRAKLEATERDGWTLELTDIAQERIAARRTREGEGDNG